MKAAGKQGFPLPLAKRILLHALRGLAHMHNCEIVHTDLKHDNIMFDVGSLTQADIKVLIDEDPSRRHPPEELGMYCSSGRLSTTPSSFAL